MKLNLDLSGVKAFGARSVVPSGRYNVTVIDVEGKATKAGGGMLVVKFEINEGGESGVVLTDRILIDHEKDNVVKMGYSKIKAILEFGGHSNSNALIDSDDMLGLKISLSVTEDDHSFEGDDGNVVETTQNNIKGYMMPVTEENFDFPPAKEAPAKEEKEAPAKKPAAKKSAAPAKEKKLPWAK